jgi:hypothetical protein
MDVQASYGRKSGPAAEGSSREPRATQVRVSSAAGESETHNASSRPAQSACNRRFSRPQKTHKSIFVTTRYAVPKVVVFVHESREVQRSEIETSVSGLVNQHLTRIERPFVRSARHAEDPPDWVGR